MSINWDATLKTWDDKEFKESKEPDSKTATLGWLACQAIDAQLPEDREVKGAEKADRYDIMLRIRGKGGNAPFSRKDLDFIKNRIAAVYSSWVVGACWKLLEGSNGEASKAE